MNFSQCPRCGCPTLEHLSTHSHCWECNYSPDSEHAVREWHRLEYKKQYPKADGRRRVGQAFRMPDIAL